MATRQETGKHTVQQSRAMEQSKQSPKHSEQSHRPERALVPHQRGGSMAAPGGWEPLLRLFDQFSRNWLGLTSPGWEGGWGLDVHEEDDQLVVRAEAPGFEPADFDIQVRGDQLILSASHRSESKEKEGGAHEWRRQEFYRSIALRVSIDNEKVKAAYRQGILTVTMPHNGEVNGKRISVEG